MHTESHFKRHGGRYKGFIINVHERECQLWSRSLPYGGKHKYTDNLGIFIPSDQQKWQQNKLVLELLLASSGKDFFVLIWCILSSPPPPPLFCWKVEMKAEGNSLDYCTAKENNVSHRKPFYRASMWVGSCWEQNPEGRLADRKTRTAD